MVGKIVMVIGIVLLVFIAAVIIFLVWVSRRPAAPPKYETEVETGGDLEASYLAHGKYETSYYEEEADEVLVKYEVYYPSELEKGEGKYPVIVMANGSGIVASKYPAVFEHYASWGFVVIGNEDQSSWEGVSSEKSLQFLLEKNEDPDSVFYGRIDFDNVGIMGHSQGGVGVFNAITIQEHALLYKAAVALSPTNEELAGNLQWPYSLEKIKTPILVMAGTKGEFEIETVIPYEKMMEMYGKITSPKAMARKAECEHEKMLYSADGYATAWFLWQLQGDEEAGKVFVGEDAELLKNQLYQDQRMDSFEKMDK